MEGSRAGIWPNGSCLCRSSERFGRPAGGRANSWQNKLIGSHRSASPASGPNPDIEPDIALFAVPSSRMAGRQTRYTLHITQSLRMRPGGASPVPEAAH